MSKEAAKASMPRTEHGQTETINFGLQPKAQQGILSKHAETHEKLLEKFITDNISSSQRYVDILGSFQEIYDVLLCSLSLYLVLFLLFL